MGVNSGVKVMSISAPIISSSPTSLGLSNEGDGVGVSNGGVVVIRGDRLVGGSVSSWGALSLSRGIWQARVDIVMRVMLIVMWFIFLLCILS